MKENRGAASKAGGVYRGAVFQVKRGYWREREKIATPGNRKISTSNSLADYPSSIKTSRCLWKDGSIISNQIAIRHFNTTLS